MGIRDRLQKRYAEAESGATRSDLQRLKRDLNRGATQRATREATGRATSKTVRMFGRGFSNIGKSLSSPSHSQRPKISQMPARRRDIGIAGHIDLSAMKPPSMRNQDIRGRRIK